MREWMLGEVDGWIKAPHSRAKTLFEAWGESHDYEFFVFLWEDGKFVGAKSLMPYMNAFCVEHKKAIQKAGLCVRWKNDPHFYVYWMMDKNKRLRQKVEREVLALLNLEEKSDEQSN